MKSLSIETQRELVAALEYAIEVADEARVEWDRAPEGMKAGKLLIALAGGCKGYRFTTDQIHITLAKARAEMETGNG